MKKFQSITTLTATARVRFFPINSEVKGISETNCPDAFTMGGSRKCSMGSRIANPATLTIKNMINCLAIGRERESGYVQNRLKMKLLIIAQMNEMVPAMINGMLKSLVNKFIIPKSTTAPMAPTQIKRMNLIRSFELVTRLISIPTSL